MRLLCVYQHAPTPGAPGIYRHRTLLSELVRRGWHVDLVSSPINYMRGVAPAEYEGRWYRREEIDGIVHHWVRASGQVHRSFRRRALNYVTFAAAATAVASRLPRPDVVWASSPPLSVGSVGQALSWRFRVPWAFEVRDLWPETAAAMGVVPEGSLAYRAADRLARAHARRADAAIVPTPGLVDLVRGHGARHVELVPGAIRDTPPDAATRELWRRRLGVPEDACLFAYVGAHGIVNGLDVLLDAVEDLSGDADATGDRAPRFVLAGDGSDYENLRRRLRERPLPSLQMLGTVPKDDVPGLLAAADVCLHLLRPEPLFESALPTKVLEYFGNHRPFVTTVPGLPARLAIESGGGYADGTAGLADEIRRWTTMAPQERRERGERAFAYGQQHYGLTAVVDRLENLLMRFSSHSV